MGGGAAGPGLRPGAPAALAANPAEGAELVAAHMAGRIFAVIWTTTPWTLPSNVAVAAHPDLGYVELDLTRATFAPGLTTIDVRAFMGYVQIRFPPGVRVESEGHAVFGFFALKGGESSAGEPGGGELRNEVGRGMGSPGARPPPMPARC